MTDGSGNPVRAWLADTTSGGDALTATFLYDVPLPGLTLIADER